MLQAILAQSDKTFWLPRGNSTISGGIDSLFSVILWISVFFFLLVTVLLIVFVIKYRHRPGVTRDPSPGHSTALEITWTLIPSIIVVFLYYYGFRQYMNMTIEPPNSYQITATGQMWQWSFSYPNGYTDPQLHIPVGVPVRVVLQSNDVIHSLFLPEFRMKKDVVPGRFNRMWFQAASCNGAAYVTNVVIGGRATELAVDSTGAPLVVGEDQFSKLPPVVQAALNARAPHGKLATAASIPSVALLNGTSVYVSEGTGGPLALDEAGATGTGDAQFSSLPSQVRAGLEQAASNVTIPASQKVQVFQDAEESDIYCAAYCGTNHSRMRSRVIIHHSQADFDKWLARATEASNKLPPVELGQKLYKTKGCMQCHSIDGSRIVGPSWKDMWGRGETMSDGLKLTVNTPYVIESIRSPLAKIVQGYTPAMPPFPPEQLNDREVNAIMAYMKSISSHTSKAELAALNGPTTAPATRPAATTRAAH